jgi:hypothetical protein
LIIDPEDPAFENFRSKYAHVHPLVFHRSVEKASSFINLFEILESVPKEPPFSWDEARRSWTRDEDVMGLGALKAMRKSRG